MWLYIGYKVGGGVGDKVWKGGRGRICSVFYVELKFEFYLESVCEFIEGCF